MLLTEKSGGRVYSQNYELFRYSPNKKDGKSRLFYIQLLLPGNDAFEGDFIGCFLKLKCLVCGEVEQDVKLGCALSE